MDIAPGLALPPLTPGEVLLEAFMHPLGLTARALAAELGVLVRRFSTSAELWMNLQIAHDLAVARDEMAA